MTGITESRDQSEPAGNFGVSRREDDQPTDPSGSGGHGGGGYLRNQEGLAAYGGISRLSRLRAALPSSARH